MFMLAKAENGCLYFLKVVKKTFFEPYSFRLVPDFSGFPPTFLAHSFHDPDVPFEESKELEKILPNTKTFFTPSRQHDFDRDTTEQGTYLLIENTINYLNSIISKENIRQ